MNEFQAPRTMTAHELGDHLAQGVWECFSDFISDGEAAALVSRMEVGGAEEMTRDERVGEEMLIYLMWAHTRAAQLAFAGRAGSDLLRRALDAMHGDVFEDMAENGTPRSQLPLFEQRVSARYSEYYAAAEVSDTRVGEAGLRHMLGKAEVAEPDLLSLALTERALVVVNPLKDYLEDVKLVD